MKRLADIIKRMAGRDKRDTIKITGRILLQLKDSNGTVIEERNIDNLCVNTGKYHVADQMSGQAEAPMSHMALGTDATPAAAAQTALVAELDRNALTSVTQGTGDEANKVTYVCDWAAGDATGALKECAIFNSAAAGKMLCRTVFDVINKGASHTLSMSWILTFSA